MLVDRRAKAGGHWVDAYPYVRLHQPSMYYGVNSLALGKARDSRGREAFARDEHATGAEVVAYYEKVRVLDARRGETKLCQVLEQFRASGRVTCFLESECEETGRGGGYTRLAAP